MHNPAAIGVDRCGRFCTNLTDGPVVPFLHWQGGLGRLVMVTHYPVVVTMHDVSTSVINYHGHLHQLRMADSALVKYVNAGWDAAHGLLCL